MLRVSLILPVASICLLSNYGRTPELSLDGVPTGRRDGRRGCKSICKSSRALVIGARRD
jgi:hypothetical protein